MHMWEEGIHKGKTFRPHRFWDCLLCCVIFLVYRSHVRSGHSQRRNLQAPQILGLSSMLCIIFGLPCTREKSAFSKGKPPQPHRFWYCLLCWVLSLAYHAHGKRGHSQRRNLPVAQILGLFSMLYISILGYRVHVEKPLIRAYFRPVFYVVHYLWLTVYMWEEGILKGETSWSRIKETAKRGTGHRLHNIRRCNFTQLEIAMKFAWVKSASCLSLYNAMWNDK
jgi:hypothetical protein